MGTLDDFKELFDRAWPEPDYELGKFVADLQRPMNVVRDLVNNGQGIRLDAGHIYVVKIHRRGSYKISVRYGPDNTALKLQTYFKKTGLLAFTPAIEGINFGLGPLKGILVNPVLVVSPFGSRESYASALELLEANPEAWYEDGVLEQAKEFKRRRDALPKDDLEVYIDGCEIKTD